MKIKSLAFAISFFLTSCISTPEPPPVSQLTYSGPQPTGKSREIKNIRVELTTFDRTTDEQRKLLETTFARLKEKNAELCSAMLQHTNLKNCDWLHLKGHNLPTVNSFAWNDLYINVTSNLLEYVENENEMAFVLANEMGHQLAEHVTENLPLVTVSFNFKTDLPLLVLCGFCVIHTAETANYAETIQQQNKLFGEITDNHFSLKQEKEADYIATYLMVRAGYDVDKGLNFLRRMKTLNPRANKKIKTEAQYFDTHAFSDKRFLYFHLNLEEIAKKQELNQILVPNAD